MNLKQGAFNLTIFLVLFYIVKQLKLQKNIIVDLRSKVNKLEKNRNNDQILNKDTQNFKKDTSYFRHSF